MTTPRPRSETPAAASLLHLKRETAMIPHYRRLDARLAGTRSPDPPRRG